MGQIKSILFHPVEYFTTNYTHTYNRHQTFLLVDKYFDREYELDQLKNKFNIIYGNYTKWDESIERINNGIGAFIRPLSGIVYYYKNVLYSDDYIEPEDYLIVKWSCTPTDQNMSVNEWLDIWDSCLKHLNALDNHVHMLHYEDLYIFESILAATLRITKIVKNSYTESI